MQNIGIITICDNTNYGNRLQNYALSKTIFNLDIECVTLWIKKDLLKYRYKTLIKGFIGFIKPRYKKSFLLSFFTKKMIKIEYIDEKNWYKKSRVIHKEYDYFIVGSDQIWNYAFGYAGDREFLKFVEYDKTISYAPSFGVSKISNEYREKIKDGINHIKYLSVREDEGREIIKELTGRDAQVVLDPTLLLNDKEWASIEKKPSFMKNKEYILTYFLGEKSEELKVEIKKIATENNLEIINLNDEDDKKFLSCGVEQFIYLFNHSKLVVTDSFHGSVFSIIFKKPFFVFKRNSKNMMDMSSRINTLLKMLKQEKRSVNTLNNIDNIFECDYDESYKILEKKKNESIGFLKKALNV